MLVPQRFLWPTLWGYIFLICIYLEVDALPATTAIPHTPHIVSYVHQGRVTTKSSDLKEFDFESIQDSGGGRSAAVRSTEPPPDPMSQLYGAFVEQLDMSFNVTALPDTNITHATDNSSAESSNNTDDLLVPHQNTLEDADEVFGHNEQHESSTTVKNDSNPQGSDSMWNRMKQSIPVLEPVRHLLNTVRDQHNQTVHAAKQFHHVLGTMRSGLGGDHMPTNESSAIETEEDRETANDSTEFKLLDFIGSIVSRIFSFITASSGNLLSLSSAGSSGGQ